MLRNRIYFADPPPAPRNIFIGKYTLFRRPGPTTTATTTTTTTHETNRKKRSVSQTIDQVIRMKTHKFRLIYVQFKLRCKTNWGAPRWRREVNSGPDEARRKKKKKKTKCVLNDRSRRCDQNAYRIIKIGAILGG